MILKQLYKIFTDSKDGKWIVGFNDFENLNRIIKEHKIKNVLELGGGIGASTAVLAYSGANVDTVEQYDKCIKIAKKLIPKDLKKKIKFHQSDVGVVTIPHIRYQYFQHYKELPKGDYDLVVIDGSGPFLQGSLLVNLPGADFIELISKTKPGTLFYIDGRKQMVSLLGRYFSLYLKTVEQDSQSILLKRTNEPSDQLKITDLHYTIFKTQGYL